MARIALIAGMAIAGAVISVATGGLGTFAVGAWATDIIAGAAVGASIGSVLSSIIFPPHMNGAPPMNDLQSMSSAQGAPIPWGYGGYRLAGQVIAAQTIQVHKNKQHVAGGKGGGPTTTVYTYTINAAISFGFGPGTITRLWADSKLIYDRTGKGPISIDTGLSNSSGTALTTPFTPTIYGGSATQLPDPTLQSIFGIQSVSGYRDQIYLVLVNFPLADFGNRLPNFRAEITSNTALDFVADFYRRSALPNLVNGSIAYPNFTHMDIPNRLGYTLNQGGNVAQKIDLDVNAGTQADPYLFSTLYKTGDQIVDANGNIQMALEPGGVSRAGPTQPGWLTGFGSLTQDHGGSFNWSNMGPGPLVQPIILEKQLTWLHDTTFPNTVTGAGLASEVDTAGYLWVQGWQDNFPSSGNTGFHMLRFNPNTLVNDKSCFIPYGYGAGNWGPYYWEAMTKVKSPTTGKNYIYCSGGYNNLIGVFDADAGQFVVMAPWDTGLPTNLRLANTNNPPCVDPQTGDVYLLFYDYTNNNPYTAYLMRIQVLSGSVITSLHPVPNTWQTITGQFLAHNVSSLLWDQNDSTLIMITAYGALVKLSPKDGSVITASPIDVLQRNGLVGQYVAKAYNCLVPGDGVLKGPSYLPSSSTSAWVWVRCSDLYVEQRLSQSQWMPGVNGNTVTFFVYDALSNSLWATGSTTGYFNVSIRIFLDRQQVAEESLDNVVADIWARTGANPSDLNVTSLSGLKVKGYPITIQGTGKGLLGPLMAAFFFDLIEIDNKLVAVTRGQSVSTVIPEGDLGLESDQYEAIPTVIQENDLPLVIDVNFYDKNMDYQQGKQTYRRNKKAKKTRNRTMVNLPLTMGADDAAAIAARALQTAWAERNQWEFKLWRMNYLTIDPTDVVQFQYNNALYQARIGKTAVGQNKTMEIMAVSEDPLQYVAQPPSAPSLGFQSGSIQPLSQTNTFIFDIPYISDADVRTAGNTGYYFSMAPRVRTGSWPGSTLMQSDDNNIFNTVDVDTVPVFAGSVTPVTPAPATLWSWDTVTKITVHPNSTAALVSATKVQVLNGQNWFWLGQPNTTGGEIMAFANSTLNADGSYTLDTLLRGLRGTEGYVGTHTASETFVMLDSNVNENVATSKLNAQQYFRGVTFGASPTSDASTPITLRGYDLKPYAPAQLKGSRS